MGRKRDAKDIKEGKGSSDIARQIDHAARLLIDFKRPGEVRDILVDTYGLTPRTGERRIASARRLIHDEVNAEDRSEAVAKVLQQCLKIAGEASQTKQLSNCIGALRLYCELLSLSGSNRIT